MRMNVLRHGNNSIFKNILDGNLMCVLNAAKIVYICLIKRASKGIFARLFYYLVMFLNCSLVII